MKSLFNRFVREEEGQDLIEYAFLAVFVVIVALLGIQALGTQLNSRFSNISTQVGS